MTRFAGRRFAEAFYISPGESTATTFDAAAIADKTRAARADESSKPAAPAAEPSPTAETPPPKEPPRPKVILKPSTRGVRRVPGG